MKIVIFIFLILFFASGNSFALRCGDEVVSTGERKSEVIRKCGEPAYVDEWEVSDVNDEGTIVSSNVEEWTYNFGPNLLLHYLKFVNGELVDIKLGKKGYDTNKLSEADNSRCGQLVVVGDKKIEVIKKCGQPEGIEKRVEERIQLDTEVSKDGVGKQEVSIEDYTYNFGPNLFMWYIKLENGVVINVQKGDYGH